MKPEYQPPSNLSSILAKNLQWLRLSRNLSTRQVSLLTGVTKSHLAYLEGGWPPDRKRPRFCKNPGIRCLFRLAKFYDVPLEDLVARDITSSLQEAAE